MTGIPYERFLKQKSRLCENGGMKQWVVNYWEIYAMVTNWISVRSILAIANIHELTTISIDCVLAFPQDDLDVDVFMDITLGKRVDRIRGEWILKLNKSLYRIKQASANWFDL